MNEYDDPRDEYADDPGRTDVIERARAKAGAPGILMIVFGAITFALAAWNTLSLGTIDAQIDAAVAENREKMDNDPQLTDEKKKEANEMLDNIAAVSKKVVPVAVVVNLVAGGLLIVGGLCLMRLAAGWLVAVACVVAILPFTTACCTGFPFGVWGLIALNSAVVRAGYRAKSMMG